MKTLTPSEKLLQSFGIHRADQIDLEAIAFNLGALVVYEKLVGCDARIVGHADKAIITINTSSSKERQRFSIGHEIGHWKLDWHQTGFLCAREDIGDVSGGVEARRDAEVQANRFAAALILPSYLFTPACFRKPVTIDTAQELAEHFSASITATTIKLVREGSFPAMVVCHSRRKREWFVGSDDLPQNFFPTRELHQDTAAFELLYGDSWGKTSVVSNEGACWIDRTDARGIRLKEQSIKIAKDRVLSLLWFQTMS